MRVHSSLSTLGAQAAASSSRREPKPRRCASRGDRLSAGGAVRATCSEARDGDVHEQKGPRALHAEAVKVSNDSPVLLDRSFPTPRRWTWTRSATGETADGGVMEHIRTGGMHSGDWHARCRRIL